MKAVILGFVLFSIATIPTPEQQEVWQPTPGTTWQWQLSGEVNTSWDVEMYDIDLASTPQEIIDSLHEDGRIVICYFSAGTWEEFRDDAEHFPEEILGEPLDDFPDERWLDIREIDLLEPIMSARLDLAVEKGCDGVEPDNVDGYANDTGFDLHYDDQLDYNRWLAGQAHERGLSVGLKNDLEQIEDLVDDFDWALNEQCFQYDECDLLLPFIEADKAVFGVEYEGEPDVYCPWALEMGFSWLSKTLELGDEPPRVHWSPREKSDTIQLSGCTGNAETGVKTVTDLIIETKDLVKKYGKFTAVNGLSLQVPPGSIYGFVGPNGAGKTTTMRVLTTLTRPTSGQAWVSGHSVLEDRRAVRRAIGYMPDEFGVYDDLRVWEYLDFFAACYDIPESDRKKLIDDLLELVDLAHRRDDMVDKLSRGMKQRLSLARTLAHDPQVLILDEPASGLDPRARVEIRELLVELSKMGKTIFFSTHILADVSEICTHIGIIEAGQMIAQGSMEDMRAQLVPHREIMVTVKDNDAAEQVKSLVADVLGVVAVETLEPKGGRSRVRIDYTGDDEGVVAINQKLAASGIAVLGFNEETKDLEAMFMRVTKGIVT